MFADADVPQILFQALLKDSVDYCSVIDSDYRLHWVSWGGAKDAVVGQFCYAVYRSRLTPCLKCPVRAALDSGRPCVMEKSICLRDGSRRLGDVTTFPVRDPKSRKSYVIKQARGITAARPPEKPHTSLPRVSLLPTPGPAREGQGGLLTLRERQVLELVAQGLTNPEIAAALAISRHTVKSHVIGIFNKLGVASRAQATLRAARLNLL